jgi:hypothetical protein
MEGLSETLDFGEACLADACIISPELPKDRHTYRGCLEESAQAVSHLDISSTEADRVERNSCNLCE